MLKFPCLVLDHDDTVVQSEATVHYPCFCEYLKINRPGQTISFQEYVEACTQMPFADLCKERFHLSDKELVEEYEFWKQYIKDHFPVPFPGISAALHKYREAGGRICVVSLSTEANIRRDYQTHFGFQPDLIFSWDLPEHLRKPSPYALNEIIGRYGYTPSQILVVDDMKHSIAMARAVGCPMAFAGWGRKEFPSICAEMESLCDTAFYSTEDFEKYLFD